MKTIEIIIDVKGQTSVQTKGFAGVSCREASQWIEQSLGIVQSDTPTAEMYGVTDNAQRLQQTNG